MFDFNLNTDFDVLAVGRATVDLYAIQVGKLEQASSFAKYLGGSPANTAVALSKQGVKTGFITKVSNDGLGRFVVDYLKNSHIDTSHVMIDDEGHKTGITIGEILGHGKCSCLMYRENCADLYLQPCDIDEGYLQRFKAVLISGTSLSKSPARETVFKIINLARKHRVKIIFDPDYREGTWNSVSQCHTYLPLAASLCDIVIATEEEMQVVCYDLFAGAAYESAKAANYFLDQGVSLVNIKQGNAGATLFTKQRAVHCPCYKVQNVAKTFGAGDSYAAGFIAQLLLDGDIVQASKRGAASAAITITGHSCSDASPNLEQVKNFMAENQLSS